MSVLPENLSLHKMLKQHYLSLAKGEECQVTYVWINEDQENLQSKTRTLSNEPAGIREIPEWYATLEDLSEVTLIPVRMYRDPFTLEPNKLVLCDLVDRNNVPTGNNQRSECVTALDEVKQYQPWFGMEQEYMLFGLDGKPLGWSTEGRQVTKACSNAVGANKMCGRDISMCHYRACMYAGVKIFGSNAEQLCSQTNMAGIRAFLKNAWNKEPVILASCAIRVLGVALPFISPTTKYTGMINSAVPYNYPVPWEFQVGTCEGIEMGDDLWMARYILHRVCEDFEIVASLDNKPLKESIYSSGCHINFSTKEMRGAGGLQYIEEAIRKLSKRHSQHLSVYDPRGGADNIHRLNSQGGTSSFHDFSAAVASRNVSVRIPGHVSRMGCGYLEDRRPAANCNPYLVMRAVVETCLLGATEEDDEEEKETMAS